MIAVSIAYTVETKGATSSDIFRLRMGPQFARRRLENIRAGLYLGCSRFLSAAIASIITLMSTARTMPPHSSGLASWEESMMSPKPYATALISLCILSYWIFVALHSNQSLYETQHSRLLLGYGAVNGQFLDQDGYWRIIVSQFTHVKFFHMLGNVVFIFLIGASVESRFGSLVLIVVYFFGGAIGQYASVRFNPAFVSSGASQALCSLAGFSLIQLFKNSRTFSINGTIVLVFIVIQCGLDLYFSERLKEGHTFGFLAGIVMSFLLLWKAKHAVLATARAEPLRKRVR